MANIVFMFVDGVLFIIGLLVWLAFFSQFVLPVETFVQRQKIFSRLLDYISSAHGPAIFVRDGKQVKRKGEEKKKGPGVLWLDSASAAVTRTATTFKQAIGPGVHFTDRGEYVASTVDLHTQMHTLGPRGSEDPFAPEPKEEDEQKKEKYTEVQKRRLEVRAWTRDGIEVIPNVTVAFKIDADPIKDPKAPGSRFGYKETEKGRLDENPVFRAVAGEGISPDAPSDANRRRVAWNQLPARVAVDLWREYLAKFTLKELFEASQEVPASTPSTAAPSPEETQALYEPLAPHKNKVERALANMLHEINASLGKQLEKCEAKLKGEEGAEDEEQSPKAQNRPEPVSAGNPKKETALQTINRMVAARMKEAEVDILDDSGRPGTGTLTSQEFKLLKERGVRVLNVNISGLRFEPKIEDQLVHQFSTTWLDSARAERDQIDRRRSFVELNAQVEAARKYAESLSGILIKADPEQQTQKEALKTLLLRTRDELIRNDRLHRRASMERAELEEIIQWVERNGE